MLAIARAMAALCAWIRRLLARCSGTLEKLSASEAGAERPARAVSHQLAQPLLDVGRQLRRERAAGTCALKGLAGGVGAAIGRERHAQAHPPHAVARRH